MPTSRDRHEPEDDSNGEDDPTSELSDEGSGDSGPDTLPAIHLLEALAAEAHAAPPPGPLLEDFEGLRVIGQGGMGIVYEARQKSLRRRVALKFLPSLAALIPQHRKRFLREAVAAASLEHEHIVPIFGVEVSRPIPYHVMKFIPGASLAEVIRELRNRERTAPVSDHDDEARPAMAGELADRLRGDAFRPVDEGARPLPGGWDYPAAVARLGVQAASALQHAHDNGVIHRDVKPGNLLLDESGHLWLTDFGLAWLRDHDGTRSVGPGGGTPSYMSPEQLDPANPPVDHRTDLYSLGVTLGELLTLRRPRPLEDHPPPVDRDKTIPRDLGTILLKATDPEVARRYESAQALGDDLRRFLRGEPVRARRPSPTDRATKWARRHRRGLIAWSATVAVLAVAAIAALAVQNRRLTQSQATLAVQNRRLAQSQAAEREFLREVSMATNDIVENLPIIGAEALHRHYRTMVDRYEAALTRTPRPDPMLEHMTALMHIQLAQSCQERAETAESIAQADAAIALLGPLPGLVPQYPRMNWIRFTLFRSLITRGTAHNQVADGPKVLSDHRSALRVIEDLAHEEPGNLEWLDALGSEHRNLATCLEQYGDLQEGLAHARQALEIATRATRGAPEITRNRLNLHRAHRVLGILLLRSTRPDEAERELHAALAVLDELDRRGEKAWDVLACRAECLETLATTQEDLRNHAEAESTLLRVWRELEGLDAAIPAEVRGHRLHKINVQLRIAGLRHRRGLVDEATDSYRRLIGELEKLALETPNLANLQWTLGHLYANCPVESLRDPERARKFFEAYEGAH